MIEVWIIEVRLYIEKAVNLNLCKRDGSIMKTDKWKP